MIWCLKNIELDAENEEKAMKKVTGDNKVEYDTGNLSMEELTQIAKRRKERAK